MIVTIPDPARPESHHHTVVITDGQADWCEVTCVFFDDPRSDDSIECKLADLEDGTFVVCPVCSDTLDAIGGVVVPQPQRGEPK